MVHWDLGTYFTKFWVDPSVPYIVACLLFRLKYYLLLRPTGPPSTRLSSSPSWPAPSYIKSIDREASLGRSSVWIIPAPQWDWVMLWRPESTCWPGLTLVNSGYWLIRLHRPALTRAEEDCRMIFVLASQNSFTLYQTVSLYTEFFNQFLHLTLIDRVVKHFKNHRQLLYEGVKIWNKGCVN